MTNETNPGTVAQCPFCAAALSHCSDKDGEFWMHPGTVTDGDCFMSGQGIFPRQLAAWNTRAAQSQPAATVQEVGRFADALENGDFANVSSALNQRMCCDGNLCGCQGSTVGEYLAYELRAALTAEPAAKAGKHDSHVTRFSDSSFYDEVCLNCGATDIAGNGWGKLAEPCPSPQPDMGSGEAIGLIGEASFAEVVDCDFWSLQLHFGKGDDARDKMRAVSDALRSAAALSPPASQSVEKDALKAAYEAGALAVHEYWQSNPGEAPRGDPEFGEAASDYAAAALPHKEEAAPEPVGEQGLREALKRAAIDLLHTPRHNRDGAADRHIEESRNRIRDVLYPATPATTTTERRRG